MPRRQLPRPPQAAKRRSSKDTLAELPSIEEQYQRFVEDGPLQRLEADVQEVLKSAEHNPHGGSLTTGALKAILLRFPDRRYAGLFEGSKTLDTFHGLLSGFQQVSIFQWQAAGATSKEWRVRLKERSAKSCAKRDQKVFDTVREGRQQWLGVAKQFLQDSNAPTGTPLKMSVLRRKLLRKGAKVPGRALMLKMLGKQRWVTLKGTRGVTLDWTVLLNREGLQEAEAPLEPDSDSSSDEGHERPTAEPPSKSKGKARKRRRRGKKAPPEDAATAARPVPAATAKATKDLEKVRRLKQLRKERKKRHQQRKRALSSVAETADPEAKKLRAA